MYQKIVVGTDGSPTAGIALDHAIGLAKATGAVVHIVNAYKSMTAMAGMAGIGSDFSVPDRGVMEDDARRVCEEAAQTARAAGLEAVTHIAEGDPADALVNIAEYEDADLIVVGNRGMMGAKRFLTGSVPNRVAHHCPCHLLVVHTT
jgi:nucleotide-binding universal stress UspA family protein